MNCTVKRAPLLLLVTLLAHVSRDAEGGVVSCCMRAHGSCKLYGFLCRAGRPNDTSVARQFVHLNNDAAVGILTLGKRKVDERRVQDRLQQLLHGSRNQAAGILTMGKRFEGGGQFMHAGGTVSAPAIKVDVERPLKYLMPTVPNEMDDYETR